MSMNETGALSSIEAVTEFMLFTNAEAKYEAFVAVSEFEKWPLKKTMSSSYTDTSVLTEVESEIFGIDAAEVPALFWAYERYENLIGSMDAYFGEFADEERRDYPEFYHEREWCFGRAVGFMVAACKLPQPQCMAWVCKIVAAEVRGGLYDP